MKCSDNLKLLYIYFFLILKLFRRKSRWLSGTGIASEVHLFLQGMLETKPAREAKGTRSSHAVYPWAWKPEVSQFGIRSILSTQSYQVVNLSFDLVNNVESWRQLPPPLVSRASPFPHKTFMKPVINGPDKEEGSKFPKSAAPQKMPFSASKVPLSEEQTQTIHSHWP